MATKKITGEDSGETSATGADALEDVQPQPDDTSGASTDDHEHVGPQLDVVTESTGAWRDGERLNGDDLEPVDPKVSIPLPEGADGPFSSPEHAAYAAPGEAGLTNEQITLRRTADKNPDDPEDHWPLDGRYRRVFTAEIPRVSDGSLPEVDWDDEQHDAMHRANCVATLQEALNKGLHPRGEASFDGPLDSGPDSDVVHDAWRQSGRQGLVYSVKVVPASVETPPEAALAYTPSAALADMGGSTLPDDGETGQDKVSAVTP